MIKILIDCFGGDNCPQAPVEGALKAIAKNPELYVMLCGDEAILQKELEERVEGRDLDKPVPVLVSDEFKDEKPVQSAVELLTDGEFRIVEETLPENSGQ